LYENLKLCRNLALKRAIYSLGVATPLQRTEYYAARVGRIHAARARHLWLNAIAVVVIGTVILAVVSSVSEHAAQLNLANATIESDATTPMVEESAYYRSCSEAWAAGKAPIYEGEPGYRPELDADSDGIACEPYHPR
jgi:hypothetical protein